VGGVGGGGGGGVGGGGGGGGGGGWGQVCGGGGGGGGCGFCGFVVVCVGGVGWGVGAGRSSFGEGFFSGMRSGRKEPLQKISGLKIEFLRRGNSSRSQTDQCPGGGR